MNKVPILEVHNVVKSFGGVHAVSRCSFSICNHSITGLIGPNGAGKTTMFNIISGLLSLDSGALYFRDRDISHLTPYRRALLGLGRSYQSIRIFPELSALENIVAAFHNNKESFLDVFRNFRPHQKRLEKKALELLGSVGLEEKMHLKAYELSYGQKKLLEILRAKAGDADLILLDEPTAGINPTLIKNITAMIRDFQKDGKTIFIVEHNIPFIMGLCERIIVMDRGENIAEGTPKEIQSNALVLEAYLGRK